MAIKKKRTEIINYRDHLSRLNAQGPARVYVLRGEEEYLRESFLTKLRELCVPEGPDSFNYHRLDGPKIDMDSLSDATGALPFLGERSFCEIRNFDINKTSDYNPDRFCAIIRDVPDFCTLAFVFAPDYAIDGRFTPAKTLQKMAVNAEFTRQNDSDLLKWLYKRFGDLGKTIDRPTAEHVLYVCGPLMSALLPEITKVAGYAKSAAITAGDIDAVAKRAPETTVFNLTDALGDKQYDRAAALLTDLLSDREETPQRLLYMISEQMRRLYAARTASDCGKGQEYLSECFPEIARQDFVRRKLLQSARNFSAPRLARAVTRCADCELAMKSGTGEEAALKDLLLALAMDENDAQD